MSLITKPFTISIKAPELTKAKLKAATLRVLNDVKEQYRREVAAWCDVFAPKDTGDLKSDLKQSTMYTFTMDTSLVVGIILHLDSNMPYSERVNDMTPPVNWKNPMTVYSFFDALEAELRDVSIPRMIRTAIKREFP